MTKNRRACALPLRFDPATYLRTSSNLFSHHDYCTILSKSQPQCQAAQRSQGTRVSCSFPLTLSNDDGTIRSQTITTDNLNGI